MNTCKICGVTLTDFEQEENDGLCHFCYAKEMADIEDTLRHSDRVMA